MRTIQDIRHECTMSMLSAALQDKSIPQHIWQDVGKNVYDKSPVQEALEAKFGTLTTHHRRLQYYKTKFNFVEPVQINLAHDGNFQNRYFHYIPIKGSLRAILEDNSSWQHILNPLPRKDGTLVDGWTLKSNSLSSLGPHYLKIMLFQDAFEVANLLGSARQKHKVLAVYYTLANFHPQSTKSNLHCFVWKRIANCLGLRQFLIL